MEDRTKLRQKQEFFERMKSNGRQDVSEAARQSPPSLYYNGLSAPPPPFNQIFNENPCYEQFPQEGNGLFPPIRKRHKEEAKNG